MHKTQETHISNREGKSHQVEKQSMVCCVFFTETKQILFGFCEKNTANPISGKNGFGLLCVGLQCLVYGKNARVVVFYGWVAWRRDWEGNGPEGRLQLQKKMVILCCDSDNSLL
jgi:hypothetical protein